RALMPALAAEGGDPRNLARLAARLARANAAVEVLTDGAERYLALRDRDARRTGFDADPADARSFDAEVFAAMPEEIRLRLLKRAIDRFGHEGPAELGKVEALLAALERIMETPGGRRPKPDQPALQQRKLKQTLAGALVSLIGGRIRIEPAPPRRSRAK
ncbi:MAG: tRNA(Ile)-lysidine synthetase, partial [Bradyrhizobium sp.]|nr:tRNA(Ile)-lysidine synthetase [Bradyrhizobium sp.]